MNPIEWQKEAESLIASAEIEDVRLALIARLEERYGIGSGVLPHATGEINYLTEPLLGVTATDAQRLAALKYLRGLDEQLSWTRRYFEERLGFIFRGSRPVTRFVDKLLRTTLSCVAIAARAKSAELRVGESLAQRISSKSISPRPVAAVGEEYWKQQSDTLACDLRGASGAPIEKWCRTLKDVQTAKGEYNPSSDAQDGYQVSA